MVLMQSVPLLSVSPAESDHTALRELLTDTQWSLSEARSLGSALAILRQHQIPVIVCERELGPKTWKDLLERISFLHNPPSLVVASRQASDELWVEALSSGAYDLLAKPFNTRELQRTLFQAWQHWQVRFEPESRLIEAHASAATA